MQEGKEEIPIFHSELPAHKQYGSKRRQHRLPKGVPRRLNAQVERLMSDLKISTGGLKNEK